MQHIFKFSLVLFLLLSTLPAINVNAQIIYSRQSGNWQDNSNWIKHLPGTSIQFTLGSTDVTGVGTTFTDVVNGVVPGDVLLLQSSNGVLRGTVASVTDNTNLVLTAPAAETISGAYGILIIPAASNSNINIVSGHTITVSTNMLIDQLTVHSGGQLDVNSGVTLSFNDGSGTDLILNGVVNVLGTVTTGNGQIVVNPAGILNISGLVSYTSNGYIRIEANGIINIASGGLLDMGLFAGSPAQLALFGQINCYGSIRTGNQNNAAVGHVYSGANVKLLDAATWNQDGVGILNVYSNGTIELDPDAYVYGTGTFNLNNNATIKIGSPDGITSSGNTGSIRTTTRIYGIGGKYTYNGSSPQVTGNGFPGLVWVNPLTGTLTIDNPAGVTLSTIITISGTLQLLNGIVFTSDANPLRLREYATLVGGSSSSFVDGPFFNSWTNLSATKFYPIGKNLTYRPVEVSFTSPNYPHVTIQLIGSDPAGSFGAPLTNISTVRYYQAALESGTAANGGTIKLTYGLDDGVTDHNNLVVAQSSTSSGLYTSLGRTTSDGTTITSGTSYNPASGNYILLGTIGSDPLPVQLNSFYAVVIGSDVRLTWNTVTEINNYGFEIERAINSNLNGMKDLNYTKIGFVKGNGNSNSTKNYFYEDNNITAGKYSYRLKQIDNDGQFHYSNTITVDLNTVRKFELFQNYPNPFNPVTTISFTLPQSGNVKLTVFNLLGQSISTLINEFKEAGSHTINFDAGEFDSGIYIYKLESGSSVLTRKMILLK